MAIKKFALITSLLLASATGGFSQLRGIVNYLDSSKIPQKRMSQQQEWMNNSKDQPFPAKPRDMWQVGVYGGLFMIDGDCPNLPGWNAGVFVRKSLGYIFSLRASIGYGKTKGLDYRKNGNFLNLPGILTQYDKPLADGRDGYYIHNYSNTTINPSLDVLVSLNNIMFHRKESKFNIYGGAGYSPIVYKTKMDAFNGATGLYDYNSLKASFFQRSRKDIRKDLKKFFDGNYETVARVNDRRQNFGDADPGKYQIRHAFSFMLGTEYRLGKRTSLGLEAKITFTSDDYLDGWIYNGVSGSRVAGQTGNGNFTSHPDHLIYTNASFNYNIGSMAKRVAPLWQLNPLAYSYGELNNPTHMKFPKQLLDDSDSDGVTDQFDIEPNTPAGCPVDAKGKSRDTDGDGVPDCRDKELITPTSCQPVNADGVGTCPPPACCSEKPKGGSCSIGSLPSVGFKNGVKIGSDADAILAAAAAQIKANPDCKICVVGHGTASKRAQQLSWDRVEAVINYFVEKQGISRDRFVFKYGEEGDANTVDLQDCSSEEGPNMVPAPHPQYRKN